MILWTAWNIAMFPLISISDFHATLIQWWHVHVFSLKAVTFDFPWTISIQKAKRHLLHCTWILQHKSYSSLLHPVYNSSELKACVALHEYWRWDMIYNPVLFKQSIQLQAAEYQILRMGKQLKGRVPHHVIPTPLCKVELDKSSIVGFCYAIYMLYSHIMWS